MLPIEFITLGRSYGTRAIPTFVDSETAFCSIDPSRPIEIGDVTDTRLDEDYVPILYSPWQWGAAAKARKLAIKCDDFSLNVHYLIHCAAVWAIEP